VWEEENGVNDKDGDPDGDGLSNAGEYLNGTDPHDPDTDDGGEKDGSEVVHGRDPLDPVDDEIRAPSFFQVRPVLAIAAGAPVWVPAVRLEYDWQEEYDQMWWYRTTGPDGSWDGPYGGMDSSGHFTDTNVMAEMTYRYRIEAAIGGARAEPAVSSVLTSEAVTPADDPYPPEALVLINGGAGWTTDLDVTLSFVPYEMEGDDPDEVFDDIVEVMLSNDPSFEGATWQSFVEEGMPWTLEAELGDIATVYARFRDEADNESVAPEMASISYPYLVYLPIVLRAY
jgi:hypothetical protein